MAAPTTRIKWYKSLAIMGVIVITLIPLWDLAFIILIMNTTGKDLVVEESSRVIEELGNTAIADISQRSREIEALTRSVAMMGESMPKRPQLYENMLPHVLSFHGDDDVAGGGIWPEPYVFDPARERRSFFYGRESDGSMKYYDDYNHGRGYHNDEWYPVVRYSDPGRCFWSKSYMDPYSYQPMVTCTVAMREKNRFLGVATVDLKLEGLHDFMERIRVKTGGYVFLLDRNNKFLSFPEPELVKLIQGEGEDRSEEFITALAFAEREPLFAPIAEQVELMNEAILERARAMPNYRPEIIDQIDADSDQINREEAEFIASVIADPLGESAARIVEDGDDDDVPAREGETNLYTRFTIDDDFLTEQESLVFVFHVPGSYWKLVAVKPISEAQEVASKITRIIITLIGTTILIGIVIAAIIVHYAFTKPIRKTERSVQVVGEMVSKKEFSKLKENRIEGLPDNELGRLGGVINSMASELESSYSSILELNANLERKVEERTAEIQNNLDEIRTLKFKQDGDYFLTSQLIKPLSGVRTSSDLVSIDTYVAQHKRFEFKHWEEEIGGDLCVAHSITLLGKPYTVFLNADAMGKSIQGAGGVLVLGAIFDANIERTLASSAAQKMTPERWLRTSFFEMQSVFESFNGSMLISISFGIVDDETGALYYLNAEHPGMVRYRNGKAQFIEERPALRKLGFGIDEQDVAVQVYQLEPGDVIFFGSDGRDDIITETNADGSTVVNEDEYLFVQTVEEAGGDMQTVVERIHAMGELKDDLSLLRIAYQGPSLSPDTNTKQMLARVNDMDSEDGQTMLKELLPHANQLDGVPAFHRALARAQYRSGDYESAADNASRALAIQPSATDFLLFGSVCLARAGRLDAAIDAAERFRARYPQHKRNLTNLARLYEKKGNPDRVRVLMREAESATG